MKKLVILGTVLVALLYTLAMLRPEKPAKEEKKRLELRKADDEEWRIFNCKLVEQRGDTIIVLHTMIRNHHGTD